jgi:hypothetical protein
VVPLPQEGGYIYYQKVLIMVKHDIEYYIHRDLQEDEQQTALTFISFLRNKNLTFWKDNCDCWKNKVYYWVKYKDECVCFIAIKDPDEEHNRWTIWSDDMGSEWLSQDSINNKVKELAWKHIDYCGKCGSCGGGRHKVVFGKDFYNVCGCTFRIDNPTSEDLIFLEKMVEIRIREVKSSTQNHL